MTLRCGLFLIGRKPFSGEPQLTTSDEQHARRAIVALSHGKPRPYRRQVFNEEPFRLSRLQIGLLMLGATVIGGLILTVAVIAQEHANATRGKIILAAPIDAPAPRLAVQALPRVALAPEPAPAPAPAPDLPIAITPPLLDDAAMPFPEPRSPPLRLPRSQVDKPAVRVAAPTRRPTPRPVAPPAERLVRAALADPDVDLIATILQLTPQPAMADKAVPVCTTNALRSDCAAVRPIHP